MTKWEYKEVFHYDNKWEEDLSELGSKGWEAFAHIEIDSITTMGVTYYPAERIIFKRTLEATDNCTTPPQVL